MPDSSVIEAMRSDWNHRAREDANYYVGFGRLNQSEEEFFATAADHVRLLETELKRRPAGEWLAGSALEIGCGLGRLLRPLSRHFHHIHGVDISDEMIRRSQHNLRGIANVSLHHSPESNLAAFDAQSIDFVYSYAVFQHIPSKEVVFHYFAEVVRVLKPGGLFVFQINGLPDTGHSPSTWEGCRVQAGEIIGFARRTGMLLLALNDRDTQYMWVTLQKPSPPASNEPATPGEIFTVTNAHTGGPLVPVSGRFGAASIWISHLPRNADLLSLSAQVDGVEAYCCYVSPPTNGRHFLDIIIPKGTRTGLVPVSVKLRGDALGAPVRARMVPPGPKIPSVSYIADGINLLSIGRIESGWAKLVMEEVPDPQQLHLSIAGQDLTYTWFCVNPLHERYEFNFRIPGEIPAGAHLLELRVGAKVFTPIPIEIARLS